MKKFIMLGLAAIAALAARAEKVTVAAAANFVYCLDALKDEFAKAEPKIELDVVPGASGNLVAQIENGAPYDVFLSADLDYPRQLIKDGFSGQHEVAVIAFGRLVLWTRRSDLPFSSVADAARSPLVRKLAIANSDTAPYGRAARETLQKLGLLNDVAARIVIGENISQTLQFVDTGNADAGFVALSLLKSPRLCGVGRYIEVPAELYGSLAHGAVLTRRGMENPVARRFFDFLSTEAARKIFIDYGYNVPNR